MSRQSERAKQDGQAGWRASALQAAKAPVPVVFAPESDYPPPPYLLMSGGVVPTTGTGSDSRAADFDLIRRVVARDEGALATLYDRYAGLVYSVAKRVLGDAGTAEEVLQDIFHQLWRHAARFDSARGSLSGWLLVTARNRAIDRLRRRDPGASESIESVPFPFALEADVSRNQLVARVKTAMAALPEAQRQTLELAYFEGMTQSEIAEQTGEPLGTVKTRMRTALQSLKRVFKA